MDYILNLILRKDKFDAAFQDVRTKLNQGVKGVFSNTIGNYLSAAGIAIYIRNVMKLASSINDGAAKARISTESFQAFKYAAEQNGATIDDVSSALLILSKTQTEAASKSGELLQVFNRLGISIGDLKSKTTEEIFLQMVKNIEDGNGGVQQFSDSMKVLGRSASTLFPAFRDGFSDAVQEAKTLGVIMNNDVIQTFDELGDSLDRTLSQLNAILIPALAEMLSILVDSLWYLKAFAGVMGILSADGPSLGQMGQNIGSANSMGRYQPQQIDPPGRFKRDVEEYLGKMYKDKYEEEAAIAERREKRRQAIESMGPGEFAPETKVDWKRPTADTLARIGLFVGTMPSQRIAQQQLNQMREIYWTVRDMKQMIDKKL